MVAHVRCLLPLTCHAIGDLDGGTGPMLAQGTFLDLRTVRSCCGQPGNASRCSGAGGDLIRHRCRISTKRLRMDIRPLAAILWPA
jgi:hypothetical protein